MGAEVKQNASGRVSRNALSRRNNTLRPKQRLQLQLLHRQRRRRARTIAKCNFSVAGSKIMVCTVRLRMFTSSSFFATSEMPIWSSSRGFAQFPVPPARRRDRHRQRRRAEVVGAGENAAAGMTHLHALWRDFKHGVVLRSHTEKFSSVVRLASRSSFSASATVEQSSRMRRKQNVYGSPFGLNEKNPSRKRGLHGPPRPSRRRSCPTTRRTCRENRWKRRRVCRGADDRDQAVLGEHAEGEEIEVAAEQRAARRTVLGLDDDRRTIDAATPDVGQHIGENAKIASTPIWAAAARISAR